MDGRCVHCGGKVEVRGPGGRSEAPCQDCAEPNGSAARKPSSARRGPHGSPPARKVLVADDTGLARDIAAELLRDAGYRVLTTSDGLTTLQTVRAEEPDLVVLDLLMPRMTGFEVLREIKREDRLRGTPVLVMSGVYKENITGFLLSLGAAGFLDKADLRDSLLQRVKSILS